MQFAIFKADLKMGHYAHARGKRFELNSSTSVAQHKAHLFDTLKELGAIVPVDGMISLKDYKALCARPDTVLATMHGCPPWDVPRRLLSHSLGDFMLVGGFFDPDVFSPNAVNIVTSAWQAKRLREHLGQAAPQLVAFTPRLKEDNFYPPSLKEKAAARKKMKVNGDVKHIVYAGRWLANKGISQLIRALNLWPMKNVKVTLVGNFEPAFVINQSGSTHLTFGDHFLRETVQRNQAVALSMLKTHGPDELRELLWSADVFVYPSVHEDENFGMAPREAVLCGVPVVVTDFCGLGQLGRGVGGLLPTYQTLAGPRYSLRQLRDLIGASFAVKQPRLEKNIRFVKDECDPAQAKADLKTALERLIKIPLAPAVSRVRDRVKIFNELLCYADSGILQAIVGKKQSIPQGLLVDGTGRYSKEFLYHKLLSTTQGFYTTYDHPPQIKPGDILKGFFRLSLWQEEKALAEIGFPGPRVKRYNDNDWRDLVACVEAHPGQELTIVPRTSDQLRMAQELVELGYLVPDIW